MLLAEDDDGHARLIEIHLREAGLVNPLLRFRDGEELLDFLLCRSNGQRREVAGNYVLLLDIRMPKIDGEEVLRQLRSHPELRKLPVIVLTTTDDPRAVDRCYGLGCNCLVVKPVEPVSFGETLRRLGQLLPLLKVPRVNRYRPGPAFRSATEDADG